MAQRHWLGMFDTTFWDGTRYQPDYTIMNIKIKMKSGSEMDVEATGKVHIEVDPGSGFRSEYVDDLKCFWPGKGKQREISWKLYDDDAAQKAFIEASVNAFNDFSPY